MRTKDKFYLALICLTLTILVCGCIHPFKTDEEGVWTKGMFQISNQIPTYSEYRAPFGISNNGDHDIRYKKVMASVGTEDALEKEIKVEIDDVPGTLKRGESLIYRDVRIPVPTDTLEQNQRLYCKISLVGMKDGKETVEYCSRAVLPRMYEEGESEAVLAVYENVTY